MISSRSESDREEIPSGNSGPGFIHTPLLKGKGPYNVVHRGARQGLVFLSRLGFCYSRIILLKNKTGGAAPEIDWCAVKLKMKVKVKIKVTRPGID